MLKSYPACTLHKISEHVWWFTPESRTDRPSLCAIVGQKDVVILDIGASPHHTKQFLEALAKEGINPPTYAVLTHWHWDHVFGISALDCLVVAHEETSQNIERIMTIDYSDKNLKTLVKQGHEVEFTREHMVIELTDKQRRKLSFRKPEITFKKSLQLHLGAVTCDIQHVGGDHASDAVVIHIPEDKVLFLGDSFYFTVYQEPRRYTQAKILPLIDKLAQFEADTYVLGHSNELLSRADIDDDFVLIRRIYALLAEHSLDKLEHIKTELYQDFDNELVDDYLEPILIGLNFD